jgi:hypothetical protein
MDSLVILLAVLVAGAVFAGIVAFLVLSAIASLVDILPPRLARAGEEEESDGRVAGRPLAAAASLRGSRPAV